MHGLACHEQESANTDVLMTSAIYACMHHVAFARMTAVHSSNSTHATCMHARTHARTGLQTSAARITANQLHWVNLSLLN